VQRILLALLVNHVDPEREHILAASAGHMMKTSASKEMHVVITKVLLLLLLIVIVDQVLRTRVIKSPNEIAEAYFQKVSMLTGGVEVVEEMSTKERASYLARQCDVRAARRGKEEDVKEEVVKQEREGKNPKGSVLFLMKAGGGGRREKQGGGEESKDVLVCAPPHSAAKAVFQQINEQMGSPCKRGHGGKIEGCPPVDNDHQVNNDHPVNNDHLVDNDHNDHTVDNDPQRSSDKTNATVNILLTRHPFDRLITEFRRSKASLSSKKGRSKRSSLGNGIDHNDDNLVISQNYNTRQVYLESSYCKNQSSYSDKQRKVGEVFKSKNNEGARIRRRRSFARHRNVLRGRAGRGRGQQFRQFIKSKVLSAEGPIVRPVTEVCGVCNRRWDQVVRLEDSDDQLHQVLQSLGGKSQDIIIKEV